MGRMVTLEHLSLRGRSHAIDEGPSQAGRVRGYAVAKKSADAAALCCPVLNPSSSRAFGAGPSFSLREKVWIRGS